MSKPQELWRVTATDDFGRDFVFVYDTLRAARETADNLEACGCHRDIKLTHFVETK